MPKRGIYIGVRFTTAWPGAKRVVFRSAIEPTAQTHGKLFRYVIGPFRTVRAARWMRDNWHSPICQCVADAERLCKVEGLR